MNNSEVKNLLPLLHVHINFSNTLCATHIACGGTNNIDALSDASGNNETIIGDLKLVKKPVIKCKCQISFIVY